MNVLIAEPDPNRWHDTFAKSSDMYGSGQLWFKKYFIIDVFLISL